MRLNKPTLKLSLVSAFVLAMLNPISANSAATPLADAPIGSVSNVLPNIMFILDDSGSMTWRSIARNGKDAQQNLVPNSNSYGDSNGLTNIVQAYSNAYNGIYYDPSQNYAIGVYADGSKMPDPMPPYDALSDRIYTGGTNRDLSSNEQGLAKDYFWCANKNNLSISIVNSVPTTTPAAGSDCKDTKDVNHKVPVSKRAFYYQWKGTGNLDATTLASNIAQEFERVDIVPYNYDGTPATYTAKTSNNQPTVPAIVRTYDEEMKNYARWWMYSSIRINMMKTAVGNAFQKVIPAAGATPSVRVGFNTINTTTLSNAAGSRIADFTGTTSGGQAFEWYKKLYSINPSSGTPLREALARTGKLYETGKYGSTLDDPVQYSCQRNIAILSTDGYWNGNSGNSGDQDNVDAGYSKRADGVYQGSTAYSETLADVALKYYKTDLRTGMTNNVPVSGNDTATHQHMNTYTIGLTNGVLTYSKTYETDVSGDFPAIKAGTKDWPKPQENTRSAVDDLWHAAVSGRGYGVVAINQKDVEEGLDRILSRASSGTSSGTGIGVASPVLSDTNNVVYRTKFDQGTWAGDVEALKIDPITGLPLAGPVDWSAASKLDLLASGSGWKDARKIITRNDSTGLAVPFLYDNLSSTQKTNIKLATPLNNDTQGAALINFLRGDTSNEGVLFRNRQGINKVGNGILGDIVASEALVVGAPFRLYQELDDKGYQTYKDNNASRAKTIYVGANDGMLHAFDAGSGNEKWAYVPSLVIRSPADNGIGVLSRVENGTPPFQHRFFVNGQAYVNDIDFNNTGTHYDTTNPAPHTPDWRTILVGGLGKGGRGYYAVDVTNSTSPSNEAAATSKLLWEFTDADMGYTYGRPTIIKTRKHGWVAIFTSGLNNTSGNGFIYVVNARTGALIKKLQTDAGSSTTPSNLMELSVFEVDNTKPYADQVYAGDMLGNLWRFDLRDMDPNQWQLSRTQIATLKDSLGNLQPITTRPQTQIDSYSKNRWVFVGTGQYLHDDDRDKSKTMWNRVQTMYAFRDGDTGTPATFSAPITRSTAGLTNISNTNTVGAPESAVGWYMDMSAAAGLDAAERIIVNPVAALDAVAWATTIPTSDVCSGSASGKLYVRQYATAKTLVNDALNNPVASMSSADGFVGLRLVKNKYGKVKIVATTPKGNIEIYLPNLTGSSLKQPRVSWRELIEN